VFCCAFRHCIVLSSLNIVTSDSASQISISSDQRSIGDASDIATLQEECIAFGKYTNVLSCHFIKITFENIRRMQILFLLVVYVFIITFTNFLRKYLFIYSIFLSFSLSLYIYTHTIIYI